MPVPTVRRVAGRSASANEHTAITIALRVPTLRELLRARRRRRRSTAAISSSGASTLRFGAGEELRRPARAGCRAPTPARPSAPAASSGGCASPAGEAEPRLPPTVPRLRICGEPTVRDAIASPGSRVAELVDDPACTVTPAPSRIGRRRRAHSASSATRVRSSSAGGPAAVEVQLDHHVGAAGDRHGVGVLRLRGERLGPGGRSAGSPSRSPRLRRRRRVVAQHRALDQPVRPVGGEEHLARVVQPERREVDEEVVPVGQRQPDLGDLGPLARAPAGPSRTGSAAASSCRCRRTPSTSAAADVGVRRASQSPLGVGVPPARASTAVARMRSVGLGGSVVYRSDGKPWNSESVELSSTRSVDAGRPPDAPPPS